MERSERETVIVVNREDLAEGFFWFGTSVAADFRRLCRRVGGRSRLLEVKVSGPKGRPAWWDAKVPAEFLNRNTWAIGKRKGRTLTERQREALRHRARTLARVKNAG